MYLDEIEKIIKIKDRVFQQIIEDFGKSTNRNKFLKIYQYSYIYIEKNEHQLA